jgi:phosphoserine aminotransferase
MKKHNFYAGPSILPQYTIDKTIEGIKDFAGSGLSILEISHRSKEFVSCMNDTIALFKELLEIPSGYQVLFLGGGASLQFAMVPMNMMIKKAAYLNTGEWASKALKEENYLVRSWRWHLPKKSYLIIYQRIILYLPMQIIFI